MCGDTVDLIEGRPTGSVRVSFGFSSTLDDARRFLRFVGECFLDDSACHVPCRASECISSDVTVESISASVLRSPAACDNISGVGESVTVSTSASDVHSRHQFPADELESPADVDALTGDSGDDGSGAVCEGPASNSLLPAESTDSSLQLVRMFIYPVKSCAAVEVNI